MRPLREAMEGYDHQLTKSVTTLVFTLLLLLISNVDGAFHVRDGKNWRKAHATFYGGADASGTMGTTPCPLSSFTNRYRICHLLFKCFISRNLNNCFLLIRIDVYILREMLVNSEEKSTSRADLKS